MISIIFLQQIHPNISIFINNILDKGNKISYFVSFCKKRPLQPQIIHTSPFFFRCRQCVNPCSFQTGMSEYIRKLRQISVPVHVGNSEQMPETVRVNLLPANSRRLADPKKHFIYGRPANGRLFVSPEYRPRCNPFFFTILPKLSKQAVRKVNFSHFSLIGYLYFIFPVISPP